MSGASSENAVKRPAPCSCSPSSSNVELPTGTDDHQTSEHPDESSPIVIAPKWAALLGGSSGQQSTATASTISLSSESSPKAPSLQLEWNRHVQFFTMHIKCVPRGYESLGLAPIMIDWIYAQQIHPYVDPVTGVETLANCGFRGSPFSGVKHQPNRVSGLPPSQYPHDDSHIAMTYTALCCLRILGDSNFSRVNRRAIIGALRGLQRPNGSFCGTRLGSEGGDMRFLFAACAISALLDDFSGIDVDAAVNFIRSCQSYDGGIGLVPSGEGHGGSTYTAVASLCLLKRFDSLPSKDSLLKWLINNQGEEGYRGRPNKSPDCCYSFWIGASLRMVEHEMKVPVESFTSPATNREFNLSCQQAVGGFSKEAGPYHPDLLHSYFGLCGLSLMGIDKQLLDLDVMLGLTRRAASNHAVQ